MIANQEALAEIRFQWAGVETLSGRVVSAVAMARLTGAWPVTWANVAWNLPLMHAYSVLNETLIQLRDEKAFSCKSIFLNPLLDASACALQWHDFDLVKAGAIRRNDVAHRGEIVSEAECRMYIQAIKTELAGWRIVQGS